MAQFRAIIQGQKGAVSRLGNKKSGINATVNGWNLGIMVRAYHVDGRDFFEICRTGGSNGGPWEQVAVISEDPNTNKILTPSHHI